MRLFTEKENSLIRGFVNAKKDGDVKNLEVGYLLKKELTCFALKWSTEPTPTVTLFMERDGKAHNKRIDNNYFAIADFLYFIEELESRGFIKLQHIPASEENKPGLLYDREKYKFNADSDEFEPKESEQEIEFQGKKYVLAAYSMPRDKQIFYNDFAFDLEKCAPSIIYPLPLAESYVDNGFQTLEDKRYDDNKKLALRSIIVAFITLFVSALALMVSCIGCYYSYLSYKQSKKPLEISQTQMSQIDSIIKAHSIAEPIRIVSNDTIRVLNVQPPKPKKK